MSNPEIDPYLVLYALRGLREGKVKIEALTQHRYIGAKWETGNLVLGVTSEDFRAWQTDANSIYESSTNDIAKAVIRLEELGQMLALMIFERVHIFENELQIRDAREGKAKKEMRDLQQLWD